MTACTLARQYQGKVSNLEAIQLKRFKVWLQNLLDDNNDLLPQDWSAGFSASLLHKHYSQLQSAKSETGPLAKEINDTFPPIQNLILPTAPTDSISTLTSHQHTIASIEHDLLLNKGPTILQQGQHKCLQCVSLSLKGSAKQDKLYCCLFRRNDHTIERRFIGITVPHHDAQFIDPYNQLLELADENMYSHLLDCDFLVTLFSDATCRMEDSIDSFPHVQLRRHLRPITSTSDSTSTSWTPLEEVVTKALRKRNLPLMFFYQVPKKPLLAAYPTSYIEQQALPITMMRLKLLVPCCSFHSGYTINLFFPTSKPMCLSHLTISTTYVI